MYAHGLVIGKFYPPHRGHKHLIDTACATCRSVTAILCWKRGESVPGPLRALWLQRIHPDIRVVAIEDDHLAPDDSEGWARFTVKILGGAPDAVFTSEAYGDAYAKFMGCVHVLVDPERATVPISGTLVRSDPLRYADFLEPCVRAYFARRICVIGAESTGTTTLAKALASHYGTVWVPEYGRHYTEGKYAAPDHAWRSDEFVHIATAQAAMEDTLAEASNGLVICDTDPFATGVWHERYLGYRSPAVEAIARGRRYALTLVTGDEIPFVQDGLRDGEGVRHWMHRRFIERLDEEGRPYVVVTGTPEARLAQAITAIDGLR